MFNIFTVIFRNVCSTRICKHHFSWKFTQDSLLKFLSRLSLFTVLFLCCIPYLKYQMGDYLLIYHHLLWARGFWWWKEKVYWQTYLSEYFISLVVTAVYHIMKENKVCPGHTFKTTKKMDIFFQLMNIYLTQTALEDH